MTAPRSPLRESGGERTRRRATPVGAWEVSTLSGPPVPRGIVLSEGHGPTRGPGAVREPSRPTKCGKHGVGVKPTVWARKRGNVFDEFPNVNKTVTPRTRLSWTGRGRCVGRGPGSHVSNREQQAHPCGRWNQRPQEHLGIVPRRTRQNGAAPPQVWEGIPSREDWLDNNLLNAQRFCLAFGMHPLPAVSNSITLKGGMYRTASPNVPHLAFGKMLM